MLRWVTLLCCSLLAACASPPTPVLDPGLFRDAVFAPPSQPISAADVFALSSEMQNFLRSNAAVSLRQTDPRRALVDMLYRKQKLALEYDSSKTRNASEAFSARAGNCLSLVIMTAAFAKAIGLPVHYQRVVLDEAWSRSGDLYFASGHVNLMLEWTMGNAGTARSFSPTLLVDFLPAEELKGERSQAISEQTIVAMYMNNRAAESMVRGAIDDAYWWARAAVVEDPRFLGAYNTLGVIYLRHEQPHDAGRVFADVLRREPENTMAMGNLVRALQAEGRQQEAEQVAAQLSRIEPFPPFHFFNAGMVAMREHDYRAARDLFAKEIKREAYYHEFHFWLAQAELGLGNVQEARRQLEMAAQSSTTPHEHEIYAAKLDRLKGYQMR